MVRKILHIDMDAFYASVEQRDNPNYRGRPIVVGGRPERRGAVAAASYEARRFGIHSAMPCRTAQQRCPELVFVAPRFEVYRQVSQQIHGIFHRYSDWVEPLSLDEAYLDVTENKPGLVSAMEVARRIRQDIRQEVGLTASAGVSLNKFLAKVASGLHKPDGLTLISPAQAPAFVEALPVERFHGIGQVTAAKMHRLGIYTGADLKGWSEAELVQRFGKVGRFYYRVARAEDNRSVNPRRDRKSIGAEKSFDPDLDTVAAIEAALKTIADQVFQRLTAHQRRGHTLTLKLKYASYEQITRSRTLALPVATEGELYRLGLDLLRSHLDPSRPVRLVGLSMSNLAPASPPYRQLCLDL